MGEWPPPCGHDDVWSAVRRARDLPGRGLFHGGPHVQDRAQGQHAVECTSRMLHVPRSRATPIIGAKKRMTSRGARAVAVSLPSWNEPKEVSGSARCHDLSPRVFCCVAQAACSLGGRFKLRPWARELLRNAHCVQSPSCPVVLVAVMDWGCVGL